jgi:exodeoxyribonuclease V alpha subunit
MNGDVGVVRKLLRKGGAVIDFGGTEYDYDEKAINGVDLAYAISIHKAQGSEYPAVVIVAHSHKKGFLTRNMLYTAVSRGKKLVVVVNPVGSMVFEAALSTDERPRNSRMLDLLKGDE